MNQFGNIKTFGLGLVAATALAAGSATAQDDTFKLGGIMSMTGGGASIGRAASIAWELAVDEINANGGILGKQIEFTLADTMTDPTHGVSETRRLIENEGAMAIVGPATSQETIPIVAVTGAAGVMQVSTAASTQLTPELGPLHFSDSVTGANQMIPNIDFAIDVLGTDKIAIISDNGGMSKAGVADIVAYMESRGVEPIAIQEFAFRTEDMTPQLFSLRGSGAEAVLLINSIGDDSRKMLENRLDIGWDVPVLANQTMTNYAVSNVEILGEEAFENVYSTQFVGMTYCPGDEIGTSSFAQFATSAAEKVDNLDQLGGASALTPYYIQPFIIAAAINGAGTADGVEVAKWLEANSDSVEMIIGPISASNTNHFLPAPSAIKVVTQPYSVREDGLVQRANCDS